MASPEEVEAQAEELRDYARSARTKAAALDSHLDTVLETARDDTLWKGPYPTEATTTLSSYRAALRRATALLGSDAEAWLARARQLDVRAGELRDEQRAAQSNGEEPS